MAAYRAASIDTTSRCQLGRDLLTTEKMRAVLFMWIFVLLLLHVAGAGQSAAAAAGAAEPSLDGKGPSDSMSPSSTLPCSKLCQCEATSVDCSHRGLVQVPRDLPKDAEKM